MKKKNPSAREWPGPKGTEKDITTPKDREECQHAPVEMPKGLAIVSSIPWCATNRG